MRIAVINEVSACNKNGDILRALEEHADVAILNVGMTDPQELPELTYIHTGLMAAVLLWEGKVDMVIGGCGTGQGFLNSAMQYPGVFCGLIDHPLDAWLFSQINGGNCISLALNKGYGWAGDVNLRHIVRELLRDEPGRGYPPSRSESQARSRQMLSHISHAVHLEMPEILRTMDVSMLRTISHAGAFVRLVEDTPCGKIISDRVK